MLFRLRVSNLAVVERAEVEFGPRLNVITGETGAGKSVLMGALELVLGGRAEAEIVREGAKEAEVEAEFLLADGSKRVVRRTVTREGRSRAWLDDESVSVSELRELGAELVDVHGPRANQKLLEEGFQRETLDAGVAGSMKEAYAAAYAKYAELRARIEELERAMAAGGDVGDRVDMLKFQVNELESADLCEDDETLVERHAAAAHAEEIVENANAVTEALGGDRGATEILVALQPKFRAIARHMPSADEWAEKAETITLDLQELSRSVADAVSKLDLGEEDLDALDARLTVVNRLKRKYRCDDVASLLSLQDKKRAELDDLEHRGERLGEMKAAFAIEDAAVKAAGAELTKKRAAAGAKLAKAVTKELKELGFREAKFRVELEPVEPEAHGCDRTVFTFEPNPGEPARPLAAIASSGEIARVMLALKTIVVPARVENPPTAVFDEIDANVGGEIGCVVGAKLRSAAESRQVIAITHLPQSAVFGERHFVVAKGVSGGRTRTSISEVTGGERVHEIARMLGGEEITSVVRKHAEELLQISR